MNFLAFHFELGPHVQRKHTSIAPTYQDYGNSFYKLGIVVPLLLRVWFERNEGAINKQDGRSDRLLARSL